jgi:5-methyltetrahydrofolate--homocysteine methyltransferase
MTIKDELLELTSRRALVLDGAMGTEVQKFKLSEDDFRGGEFKNHGRVLSGMNDVLCLTRPDLIANIHTSYLSSGADIIETCSFNANKFSLSDYGLASRTYDIAKASAEIARMPSRLMKKFTAAGTLSPEFWAPRQKAGASPPM